MDNFFDKFRSGAGKAAFEADKLRRVTAVQNTIRSLKNNYEKGLYQVGKTAFSLHQNQQINQPDLLEVCERQAAISAQIQAREREIEEIRVELFVDNMSVGQVQYGRLCPNGHGAIPPQDKFCQKCGAQAIEVPPPPASQQCTNCGSALAADARFCANCGQTAPVAPIPENACPACHAPLLEDALFCAECGHRLEASEPKPEPEVSAVVEESISEDLSEGQDDSAEQATVSDFSEPEASVEETSETVTVIDDPDAEMVAEEMLEEETAVETFVCPSCQTELLPGAAFCAECGHHITE